MPKTETETETRTCPACGQSVKSLTGLMIDPETLDILIDGTSIHFSGSESIVFHLLYKRFPSLVTKEGILDVLYSAKSDEPYMAIVSVYVSKINTKLQNTRIKIENVWARGYRLRFEPEKGN